MDGGRVGHLCLVKLKGLLTEVCSAEVVIGNQLAKLTNDTQ